MGALLYPPPGPTFMPAAADAWPSKGLDRDRLRRAKVVLSEDSSCFL